MKHDIGSLSTTLGVYHKFYCRHLFVHFVPRKVKCALFFSATQLPYNLMCLHSKYILTPLIGIQNMQINNCECSGYVVRLLLADRKLC